MDIACGIGRTSISIAQKCKLNNKNIEITAFDLLPIAIFFLKENVIKLGVSEYFQTPFIADIEDYDIQKNRWDLIVVGSVLEHTKNKMSVNNIIRNIIKGIKKNGIVQYVIVTDIYEVNTETGKIIKPHAVELNLSSKKMIKKITYYHRGWKLLSKKLDFLTDKVTYSDGTYIWHSNVLKILLQKI